MSRARISSQIDSRNYFARRSKTTQMVDAKDDNGNSDASSSINSK